MKTRKILLATLMIAVSLLILSPTISPTHAAPVWSVDLDANSASQTDVAVQPSCPAASPLPGCLAQTKTFRIGAVVNATSTDPLTGVFGWQFAINYNSTLVVPQGDPNPANPYPDAADTTAMFGAQTTSGTVNWAGKISTGQAFGSVTLDRPGHIFVFLTILSPAPTVAISAKNILANIAFELLNSTITPQSFTISEVSFVDMNGAPLPGVIAGAGVTEVITNAPPKASFTVTQVSSTVFNFDATASSDPDGTIPNPGGYFWDFGDGTQDLGITGPTITNHDFGVLGNFTITLRVADALAATGAARDGVGNAIYDAQYSSSPGSITRQPSHTSNWLISGNLPPVARFTFLPTTPIAGSTVTFDASTSSDDADGISNYYWVFGDGGTAQNCAQSSGCSNATSVTHTFQASGAYSVNLTVVDAFFARNSTFHTVNVASALVASFTVNPSSPIEKHSATFTASVNGGVSPFSYIWDFGDGLPTQTGVQTTHTYTAAGSYNANLTVTDSISERSSALSTVVVRADAPPVVNFSPPTNATAGKSFTLALTLSDSDGSVQSLSVDWGDSNVTSYTGSPSSIIHTYANSGTFVITVTATDDGGKTGLKRSSISVAQGVTAPPQQPSSPLFSGPIPYIIIAVVVAAAVAAIVILRRRRVKSEEMSNQPTTPNKPSDK